MSEADKEKWDAKYRSATHPSFAPSKVLESVVDYLPSTGSAIDLAGGVGRHSIWLAQRGLDVTLADVSPVALAIASDEANAKGVPISMLEIDLESQSFPAGPWDVVISEPSHLWVAGLDLLFTREFYERVHQQQRPDHPLPQQAEYWERSAPQRAG